MVMRLAPGAPLLYPIIRREKVVSMLRKTCLAAGLTAVCLSATLSAQELQTETERYSYILGLDVGESLKNLDTELDLDVLKQGIQHVLEDQERAMSAEEIQATRDELLQQVRAQAQSRAQAQAEVNRQAGADFLAENAQRESVEVTDSGLQYEVIEAGDGERPSAEDTVTVHYRGTLIDGTEFDSSYSRGEPATFPLNGVIAGWTEGLQLMPVGSTYKFFIPSELAYGERGAGQVIGPNSTLVFDVELLEIQ
jgi:FKBP-type peptidyl-prolyl cis-trans isomerase FklB